VDHQSRPLPGHGLNNFTKLTASQVATYEQKAHATVVRNQDGEFLAEATQPNGHVLAFEASAATLSGGQKVVSFGFRDVTAHPLPQVATSVNPLLGTASADSSGGFWHCSWWYGDDATQYFAIHLCPVDSSEVQNVGALLAGVFFTVFGEGDPLIGAVGAIAFYIFYGYLENGDGSIDFYIPYNDIRALSAGWVWWSGVSGGWFWYDPACKLWDNSLGRWLGPIC
jgi:hypothetical protein